MSETAGAFTYDPEKNYDDDIMSQQRDIEREVAASQPIITDNLAFDDIVEEYANEDAVYRQKIQDLKTRYKGIRKTRGDGNCFFRAFGFAYLESLLNHPAEYKRFRDLAQKSKDVLLKLNFPPFTLEDFHDVFMEIVGQVEEPGTVSKLLETFNDQGQSDYFVVYLRLLVSGHLQSNEDDYMPFIDGARTVKEFCAQEVEPMGRESDHIHIVALTKSLSIPVKVEYMDRGGTQCNAHHFTIDDKETAASSTSMITLLYRPSHYDIIYPL